MRRSSSIRRVLILLAAASALAAVVPAAALAAPAIDQQNPAANNTMLDIGLQAQTFTVGVTGALTSVDLSTYMQSGTGTVHVAITAVDGSGFPTGPDLATGTATIGSTAAFTNVPLSPNRAVTSGEHYAITFYVNDLATQYNTQSNTTGAYGGGTGLFLDGSWSALSGDSDWTFRTYVDSSIIATPNPCASPTLPPDLAGAGAVAAADSQPTLCTTPPPTSAARSNDPGSSGSRLVLFLGLGFAAAALGAVVRFERRNSATR
jgi:hypothetical protein